MDDYSGLPSLMNERVMYRSRNRILGNVLTVTLGSIFFGYCLTYLSAIPFTDLVVVLNMPHDENSCFSTNLYGFLSGIIPIGAAIGALLSSLMNKKLTRKNSFFATATVSILGTVLTLIPSLTTFIAGRVIQGICVGLYSVIVPLYINEICPLELAGRFGALNQFFIVFGIFIASAIAATTEHSKINTPCPLPKDVPNTWIVVFSIPIVLAVAQILLLKFAYPKETPRYLLSIGKEYEAFDLIKEIYLEQFVEDVMRQKKEQVNIKQDLMGTTAESQIVNPNVLKLTYGIAFHVSILQQMSGINVVIVYGSKIINQFNDDITVQQSTHLSDLVQLGLISIQLVACFLATFLLKKVGRVKFIQLGTFFSIAMTTIIAISSLTLDQYPNAKFGIVITSLCIFMFVFGLTLGPVAWLYIPQIVPANIIPYTTLVNWLAATITIILFPILQQKIHESVLFISTGWCLVSLVINHYGLVETKNKTPKEIQRKFEQKLQFED